jgi:hypothetical protein
MCIKKDGGANVVTRRLVQLLVEYLSLIRAYRIPVNGLE